MQYDTVEEIRQWQGDGDGDGWFVSPSGKHIKLGGGVRLGRCVTLGNYVTLGDHVEIGSDVMIGNNVTLGDYVKLDIAPPAFSGSRYPMHYYADGVIRSGCIVKPLKWWERNIGRCAEGYGYTMLQKREYKLHVKLIGHWMRLYGREKCPSGKNQS